MDNEGLQSLISMFPQIDKDIIVAILDQNRGDVNATIPQLLEISDPSTQQPPKQRTPPINNNEQIKLDEEIARRLAQDLNDEEFARQLQEEEARNRQQEIQREQAQKDDSVPFKEKISAGFESFKQKSREIFEKVKNKGTTDQRNMNRAQYSNLPDNNEDSILLNNYDNQVYNNSNSNRNDYYMNGEIDEEETLDRRNPNFQNNNNNSRN